jgi:glycosyltransferase involved in cell wall biosynthesis
LERSQRQNIKGISDGGMKVVHVGAGHIPVPPGDEASGTEEYIYHLTDHLGRLGSQVTVIDIKSGIQQEIKRQQSSARFHAVWHPSLPHRYKYHFLQRLFSYLLLMLHLFLFAFPASAVLNRLFGSEKIEVVHTHTSIPALAAMMVNRLRRRPAVMVYTMHTGFGTGKSTWRLRLPALPEILALKWADHVIAPSPAIKRWLISEFNLDPDKITQIYTGADITELEEYVSSRDGDCHQSNILLCVSGISARKNQFTIVKAIPQVVAVHPEVKFVFAGVVSEAAYFSSMQRFITENNLSPYVEFRGMVSRQEIYNLYSDARLFLFPTTAEAQGLVLAEAMAAGLPVIASTIEPITDMVSQEEGSAILVDPYDVDGMAAAIIRLLGDSSLRQSMAQRGGKLAHRFSHEHIVEQILDLYHRLVRMKHNN